MLVVIGLVITILRLKADAALVKNARQASAIERLHWLDAQKVALLADIANQLSAIHTNVQKKDQSLKELETNKKTSAIFSILPCLMILNGCSTNVEPITAPKIIMVLPPQALVTPALILIERWQRLAILSISLWRLVTYSKYAALKWTV